MIAQNWKQPNIHHQENEQIVVYSHNAILLSNKTITGIQKNMDESQKHLS